MLSYSNELIPSKFSNARHQPLVHSLSPHETDTSLVSQSIRQRRQKSRAKCIHGTRDKHARTGNGNIEANPCNLSRGKKEFIPPFPSCLSLNGKAAPLTPSPRLFSLADDPPPTRPRGGYHFFYYVGYIEILWFITGIPSREKSRFRSARVSKSESRITNCLFGFCNIDALCKEICRVTSLQDRFSKSIRILKEITSLKQGNTFTCDSFSCAK